MLSPSPEAKAVLNPWEPQASWPFSLRQPVLCILLPHLQGGSTQNSRPLRMEGEGALRGISPRPGSPGQGQDVQALPNWLAGAAARMLRRALLAASGTDQAACERRDSCSGLKYAGYFYPPTSGQRRPSHQWPRRAATQCFPLVGRGNGGRPDFLITWC